MVTKKKNKKFSHTVTEIASTIAYELMLKDMVGASVNFYGDSITFVFNDTKQTFQINVKELQKITP